MIIVRGVPFLLPAGKRKGIAQLSGKKTIFFKKQDLVYLYDFHTI